MRIIFSFVLPSILASFVSAISRKITLYQHLRFEGESVTLTYTDDECINLADGWKNRASSVNTYGQCITLYSESNCAGVYAHVYPNSWGYHRLWLIDFNDLTISFKRCKSNSKFKPGVRPTYLLTVSDQIGHRGDVETLTYKTSECLNLPLKLQGRVNSVNTHDNCVTLYEEPNCKGRKKDVGVGTDGHYSLGEINFSYKPKSFTSCDLYYTSSCGNRCPKLIYKGSNEWEFWAYLLSMYSFKYRNTFEKLVEKYPNGSIPWDFLFAPNTAAKLPGDQYQDAFVALRRGILDFNAGNVNVLFELAKRVKEERREQLAQFSTSLQDHDLAVHRHLKWIWEWIVDALAEFDKQWNYPTNEPECGQRSNDQDHTSSLINDGAIAQFGDDPWHVAIYRTVNSNLHILTCGASLISRTMAISAAHCFYNEALRRAANRTSDYEIYVGKYTRNYSTVDSDYQRIHKIKSLVFSPKGYNPIATKHHGSDIILIILETPVTINERVAPVCLDWTSANRGFNPPPRTEGRLVGWGENDNTDVGNEILLTANLPYISYADCIGKVKHVTNDKFCGGSLKGPGARKGDSGGGFVFESDGRYYLRGIVSTKDKDSNSSVNTFTDISLYLEWLRDYF